MLDAQNPNQVKPSCSLGVFLLEAEDDLRGYHTLVCAGEFEFHVGCQAHGASVFEHMGLNRLVLDRVLHGPCRKCRRSATLRCFDTAEVLLTFLIDPKRGETVEYPWTDIFTSIGDDTYDHLEGSLINEKHSAIHRSHAISPFSSYLDPMFPSSFCPRGVRCSS